MDGPDLLLEQFFWRPDEDVTGLFEPSSLPPPQALAPLAAQPEAELLTFRLGDERFAVRLEQVREILRVPPITEVPGAPRHVLGVMSLRGEVLPVFDLQARLGLGPSAAAQVAPGASPPPKGTRVVVVRSEDGDAALWVDEVTHVIRVLPSALERPPAGMGTELDCIVALVRHEGVVTLLDHERALGRAREEAG